jgi:cell wall-associated NlpC family hydrolase
MTTANRLSPALYADLIGKPFKWHGRGPDAYDCIGLLMEIYRRQGIFLPDYKSNELPAANAIDIGTAAMSWARSDWPFPGAAILLKMHPNLVTHVGVIVDERRFIHTLEQMNGVHLDEFRSPLWQKRTAGYYRWTEEGMEH